ncbi:MAG: hypothetical protein AMXMBFR59_24100 [Rhodanobacteraceae bacterium]
MNAKTSTSLRRTVLVIVTLAALVFGAAASARDRVSISIGGPGYGISYSNWGGGHWGGYYSSYRPYYGHGYGYYDGYRGPYRGGYYTTYHSPYPVYRRVIRHHHQRPVVVRRVERYDDGYYHRSNDRYYDRDDRYDDRDRYYDR